MDELLLIPAAANSLLCPAFPLQVDLVLLGREFYFQELPDSPRELSQCFCRSCFGGIARPR